MKKLFTVFALMVSAVVAMAQVPAFMNYSCSIKGSDSANTMIAGKPMLYSKGGKTYVSESATTVPDGYTASFNAYSSKIPVNGFSFMEMEVDRGELIGKTDVKNRLVGPFRTDITNTIVIKQSASVPPLY